MSRERAWMVAIAATLTMTCSYIDRSTFAVLAPTVTKALDISETEYGWLTTAFSIAYLVATPISGWWIERAGARRGLVGSVIVWSSIAALHALVPGFFQLFVLRVALGVAEGPSFPGAVQTVQRVLPPGDRSLGFGFLFTGSSIGGMVVPPLAAWLYGLAGWRVAFLGTTLAGALWIPMWIAVTSHGPAKTRLDDAAIARVPRLPITQLLRSPAVWRAFLAVFATAPAVGLGSAWGSKYLVRAFAVKQEDVGHYLWLPPLLLDVGAIGFGALAARRGRTKTSPAIGLFAIAMTCCACLALLPLATSPWMSIAIFGLSVFGGGACYTILLSDLLVRLPPSAASVAGGIVAGGQSLSLIICNPLTGRAVEAFQSYDQVALATGLWVLPGCLLWLLWHPRTGLDDAPAA